mgnify:CR=1 FL=1
MMPPDHGARARLRVWQAARAWMPNRHEAPLHEVESMAEKADERMKEAARATGNKSLLGCIEALRLHSLERRKR